MRITRAQLPWIALAGALAAPACGTDGNVFGSGSGGSGGDTATSSGSSSSSSSSGTTSGTGGGSSSSSSASSSGSSASSSGSSSSSSSSSSSGQGGGQPGCDHEPCAEGASLEASCDPCVAQICGFDPFCCSDEWDAVCVGHVWSVCGIDCAPNAPTCEEQYGQAPGYSTCIQGADSCEFAASVQLTSCDSLCGQAGGECLEVFNNQNQTQCQHAEQLYCDLVSFTSVICICSRGCGGGPACSANEQCVNGTCV